MPQSWLFLTWIKEVQLNFPDRFVEFIELFENDSEISFSGVIKDFILEDS